MIRNPLEGIRPIAPQQRPVNQQLNHVPNVKFTTGEGERDIFVSRTTTAADSAPVSATQSFPTTASVLDIEFGIAGTVGFLALNFIDGTSVGKIVVPNQASPSKIVGSALKQLMGVQEIQYSTQLFGAGSIIVDIHYVKASQ